MIIFILLIVMLSILEIMVFYYLKKYNDNNNILFFIVAVMIYACIAYLISLTFRFQRMGIINAIWNGISLLTIILLGYFAFGEKISGKEFFAIFLIIVAIFLVV